MIKCKNFIYKKFASLMSPTTSYVAQNLFYAQNQFIDLTYIQKLSTFFKYYNILKRKKYTRYFTGVFFITYSYFLVVLFLHLLALLQIHFLDYSLCIKYMIYHHFFHLFLLLFLCGLQAFLFQTYILNQGVHFHHL